MIVVEDDPRTGDGDPVDGQIRNKEGIIRIRKLPQQAHAQTLMHEIIHGVTWQYGVDFSDEEDIDRFATGLYQVLKDNKHLWGIFE